MIFWLGWGEACCLLIREYLVVTLVFSRNSLGFYAFSLLLVFPLNCPFLGKVHFANDSLCHFVSHPCNPYFFELYFLPKELSFLPINFGIELPKPGIAKNNVVLSQVGNIESLGDLLLSSSHAKDI
jgi:hypothetical protein